MQKSNSFNIPPTHCHPPQVQQICFKILPNIDLPVTGSVAMEATLISSFPPSNMVTGLMNSTFHYGPE